MKEWFLSTELVGLAGMANSSSGVAQKARRNKWLSRGSKESSRALEYHISNFHPDVKKQLIEKYVTDPREAKLLMTLSKPLTELKDDHEHLFSHGLIHRLLMEDDGSAACKAEREHALNLLSTLSSDHLQTDNQKDQLEPTSSSVTYYDIAASAGAGYLVEYEPSRKVELNETLQLALNIQNPSRARLLNMEGDSMHPTLKDKSILAIEYLENFKQDGVYVFTFDSTLYVKRLQKNRDGIKVISDNPIYDAWFINRDEVDTPIFTIHGRVTGCAQSV